MIQEEATQGMKNMNEVKLEEIIDSGINSFRDLRVWQKGIELVKEIYKITRYFPKEEQDGLASQMRKAVVSIPSSIAEGFKRKDKKLYKQFLGIALGYLAKLETQIAIATELRYIEEHRGISEIIDYICKMKGCEAFVY